ncbi:hypothetical protein V6N13_121629 [Hibiscus sabdariffa]
MIQLSLAIQHALHYPLLMSSLTALNIAFFLLSCLILACAGVSLFITFIIYIQIVAYETRVRNRLHIPNTINMSSEAEDDGSGLNVQVLERLSPSVTINEDDKHELNSNGHTFAAHEATVVPNVVHEYASHSHCSIECSLVEK